MPPQWTRLTCRVLTPEGTVCSVEATHVGLPASDGRLGILDGRSPVIAMLIPGLLTIDQPQDQPLGFWIDGGLAQVADNKVTVLAERCESMGKIQPEQVWVELDKAKAMSMETAEQFDTRQDAIFAARKKFSAVQNWPPQSS